MRIIFCDSGFSPKEVDYMYAEEYKAAKKAFIPTSFISFEALKREEVDVVLKGVRANEEKEIGMYRGWMLKPKQYEMLYQALLEKNIKLINDPVEYKFCHYLPESYEAIKAYTPKTTFKKLDSAFKLEDFQEQIKVFGNKAIIVKDYVKSQKHYWEEACFIPDAGDVEQVNSVVRKFIELQDTDLNEGLVFREFVELEELTSHSKSGMPLTKEFRLFIKNGEVMSVFKYWDEGDYKNVEPILEGFEKVIPNIKSSFFTMDIAKKKNGEWIIVELGDGQVAGLPDNADKDEFYNKKKMKPIHLLFVALLIAACTPPAQNNNKPENTATYTHKIPDVPKPDKTLNVGLLIMEGVYNTELTAPMDIFQHTIYHVKPGMKVFTVAKTKAPLTSFEGLVITPDYGYADGDVPPIDVLVVPSAEHHLDTDLEDKAMIDFVRTTGEKAMYVTSHCDGSFVLAKAGLLDGFASTTFPGDIKAYKEMFPNLKVHEDVLFVHDKKFITSAGGAKSFEAALYLVELLYGKKAADGVAKGMVIDWDINDVPAIIVK